MHRRLTSTTSSVRNRRAGNKRAVRFNVMVAGSGGSGKSTFINTLCGRALVSTTGWMDQDPASAHKERPVRLRTYTEELSDADLGVVTLRFIETTGYGDNLDNSVSLREILKYIETQFDEVLAEEARIRRNPRFTDNRIHALVYLIDATGHGLRETDVEFLKMVGTRVNVIPVLSKSDALTKAEVQLNKRLIREDIDKYQIPIYEFAPLEDDDEVSLSGVSSVQESVPFAIVGASDGTSRTYPWGTVQVDDPKVSDFPLLRDTLLYTHLNDLKETTYDYMYENYRTERLSSEVVDEPSNSQTHIQREEMLRQEEEKLQMNEQQLQRQLEERREELRRREAELKELEARIRREAEATNSPVLTEFS